MENSLIVQFVFWTFSFIVPRIVIFTFRNSLLVWALFFTYRRFAPWDDNISQYPGFALNNSVSSVALTLYYYLGIMFVYSNEIASAKFMLCRTGSVTVISSPSAIKEETGLCKFARVAFSRAGGFCMYRVLLEPVMLGAMSRRSPSFNC